MRPLHTMGLDVPGPGSGVLHTTFSPGPHLIGSPRSALVPSPRGPRKDGQSAPPATPTSSSNTRVSHLRSMRNLIGKGETSDGAFGRPHHTGRTRGRAVSLQRKCLGRSVFANSRPLASGYLGYAG